jgi:hypothetical protein
MNAAGTLQQFTFTPDLSLTPGKQYVAFLSLSNLPPQQYGYEFAMPITASAGPGNLVTLSNGTDPNQWISSTWGVDEFNYDAWLKASFSDPAPVPGPIVGAGLPGLASACFGLPIWLRSRRKREPALAA